MADSTEGDTMVLYLDILALTALTAGLVIHSFIIVVNVNDWRKGRSVTPVDQVVIFLGISRMCGQCVITLYKFVGAIFLKNLDLYVTLVIMDWFFLFFIYANIWSTSLLSIVFCLKISSLRTRLFLYLRSMIEQRTVHCIVASLIFSTFSCLLSLLVTLMTKDSAKDKIMENLGHNCTNILYIYNYTIGAFIPLLFCCVSSVVLFASLYHHITQMKMSGNLSINLETYYSAMKFVSFTFLCNIIYYTGYFVSVFYYSFYCVTLLWLSIVLGFLPALHSSYLIYRIAKLRSQMSKVLQNVMDFFFQLKYPETREDIEIVAQCGE